MKAIKRAKSICAVCALSLAGVWGFWYGWLERGGDYPYAFALMGVLPLVLLVPGMLKGKVLPTAVLGFLALFYLAHGFTELVANPEAKALATASTLLSLLLFLSAGHSLRLQSMPPRS